MEAALQVDPGAGPPPRAIGTGEPLSCERLRAAPLRSWPVPDVLAAPLTKLRGAGPKLSEAAAEIGIECLGDLLRHIPRAYRDRASPDRAGRSEAGGGGDRAGSRSWEASASGRRAAAG